MFLSVSNYVFTVIFLAEMAIKVNTAFLSCLLHFSRPRLPLTHRIVPPGCSSGLLLWDADLPPVQLERSRWFIGVCISGGHTGFSGLHRWEPDPGHPQSPPSVADATPTQVRAGFRVHVCSLPVFLDGKPVCVCPGNPPTQVPLYAVLKPARAGLQL